MSTSDQMQRHRVREVLLVRDGGPAVADEGEVEARAAHVAGEHVFEPGRLTEPGCGDRARRGTGQHGLRRRVARGAGGHHSPVALHQQELVPEAGVLESLLGGSDVARHQRLHPAVQGGGARALELADLREHLRTGADECVGPKLARDFRRPPLVGRIRIGMDEVNDERLAARVAQGGHRVPELVLVERENDPALRVDTLGHVEAQLARNQRLEAAAQPPAARPGASTELKGVAEPAGCDQPALRALAFQDRVGGDGGAVHQGLDGPGGSAARVDSRHEALGLCAGCARDLCNLESARLAIEGEYIGEGTAYVHTDAISSLSSLVHVLVCHLRLVLFTSALCALDHADARIPQARGLNRPVSCGDRFV